MERKNRQDFKVGALYKFEKTMNTKNSIEELKRIYSDKHAEIAEQLAQFQEIHESGDDQRIFEELVFCILTSAVGPVVGTKSLNAIKDVLLTATAGELTHRLEDIHKYPEKSDYIVHTREYFNSTYNMKIRNTIFSITDPIERRDFIASNKDIKGLGYTQSSHFLRNIGFRGYAILDRNVTRELFNYGILESQKPPTTKKQYIDAEHKMSEFTKVLGMSIEELDMVLWSKKTGRIPK